MTSVRKNQGLNTTDIAELLMYGVNVHPWPLAADGAITTGADGAASFGIVSASGSRFEVAVTQTAVGEA